MDILGFAGIWNHVDPLWLSDVMVNLRSEASSLGQQNETFEDPEALRYDVVSFSDTFLLAAIIVNYARHEDVVLRRRCFELVAEGALALIHGAALEEIPLNFRGAISAGKCLITGDVFVGPAVDDAARNHQQADGAFVWLTDYVLEQAPTLSDGLREWAPHGLILSSAGGSPSPEYTLRPLLLNYQVPLKSSGSPDAPNVKLRPVLNPVMSVPTRDPSELRRGMEAAFKRGSDTGMAPEVVRKMEATFAFLDCCEEALKREEEARSRRIRMRGNA